MATAYIHELWSSRPKQAKRVLREEWPELHIIVSELTGKNLSEKAYKFCHALPSSKQCGHCGADAVFLDFRRGYTEFCSAKCVANSTKITAKKQNSTLEKYGVTHYSKTDDYRQKFTTTCIEKYGVVNPGQIPELKAKRSRAKQLTYFTQLVSLVSEFAIPKFSFDEYVNVRDDTMPWECVKCNTEFMSHLFGKLPKCTTCYPPGNIGAQSSIERDILNEVRKFYHGEIVENSRSIIKPQELDLYFPEKKFAIEVNGIYWHSADKLTTTYHQDKFKACNELGITLLMVTDYEWKLRRDVVIKMIQHRLGDVRRRIHTRLCTLMPISNSNAKVFLDNNHMHGYARSSGHLGLYYNNELVSVLSYMTKNRFNSNDATIEIVRLALLDSVPGVLGKYIKYLQNLYPNYSITSYADLRYGTGAVYANNNFQLTHTTKPGYWYFIGGELYHRLSWTKQKLVKLGYPAHKTELEIMTEMGALRIYDCGHHCYKLTPKD